MIIRQALPADTPSNLAQLIKDCRYGYVLRFGYSLLLKHGSMGSFPALFKGSKTDVVVTFDMELIHNVWRTMEPRRSEVHTHMYYVNFDIGVCYQIFGPTVHNAKESYPIVFLTQVEFSRLTACDAQPFGWALGLWGTEIKPGEFKRQIEASLLASKV